jgi:hypothetical protein
VAELRYVRTSEVYMTEAGGEEYYVELTLFEDTVDYVEIYGEHQERLAQLSPKKLEGLVEVLNGVRQKLKEKEALEDD